MGQTSRIKSLYDEIETNLRSLKSIGVEPSWYGCLLVPILNLQLSRTFHSETGIWKIDDIMKELRLEIEARERCEKDGSNGRHSEKGQYPHLKGLSFAKMEVNALQDIQILI